MIKNDIRVQSYNFAYPKYPKLVCDKGWIYGVWVIGNYYKGSGFYGSYPPSYVDRVRSLFPEMVYNMEKIKVHLFSGSVPKEEGWLRIDIRSFCGVEGGYKPDILADIHQIPLKNSAVDFIMADPPYTNQDAFRYGVEMINRFNVIKQCAIILKPGGFLVWLDTVFPMYRKAELKLIGTIGLIRSTNHRTRTVFIFQRN
jgi:hypothetical protein